MIAHSRYVRGVDRKLAGRGLGRAHHRLLYFVGRRPGITVRELLSLLGITKQSLSRVMREMIDHGLLEVRHHEGSRRDRLIALTAAGEALEAELYADHQAIMSAAYSAAGAQAVRGYWRVLEALIPADAREQVATLGR